MGLPDDVRGPRTTLVIVTYQSVETVAEALREFRPDHEGGDIQCVVVDNASTDGSADLVRRDFPWVDLVESPVNLGYGRGCNLGCRSIETRYTCVRILERGAGTG